ncbi:hypothetical protein AERO9A_190137 [Aeromonas salmonicida]|nr:hypothetical protein AERO9A_190137 [Aeromonas salmonicida]
MQGRDYQADASFPDGEPKTGESPVFLSNPHRNYLISVIGPIFIRDIISNIRTPTFLDKPSLGQSSNTRTPIFLDRPSRVQLLDTL